jgi:phosphohistidine phosphatase
MILTIWRHGAAEDGVNDRLRELTMTGRDDVGFGCSQFHQACKLRSIHPFTTVLHSPWVRTTQTAEIITIAFNPPIVGVENALRPDGGLAAVDAVIVECDSGSSDQHVALVSHQPLVSYLVDHYLGESGSVPPLPPGGWVTLSLDVPAPACGKLLFWAFPPEYEVGV